MNIFFKSLIFSFILAGLLACKKDDEKVPPDDNNETTEYEQYGVPFEDVPDTEDIIMYEINLRAFSSTGDIQGIINKIDHIEDLGVNVIWLMPIHPIGQVNSVNSPYSVKDYKAVSSEYGTLNDLRNLTDEAHSRGIAVIMDWVANHTAWDNEWIQNKSWYTQDASGNIIHPPGTNWLDVADLNYNNQVMRDTMVDAMKYWLYVANIDGFRCDYADGVPFDFWQAAWQTLNAIPDRKFIFFAEGSRNDHFTAGFDLNFSWPFYGAVKDVFNGQAAGKIFTAHSSEYASIPSGKQWIRFTTNHDESAWDATPISLFNGVNGALAASVVTIFTGGVPLIYGSQEVGTANNVPFFYNSTINWNSNPQMLAAYKKMLQFYSASPTAKRGQNTVYQHNDVACFRKSFNNEEIVIIANLRNYPISYPIPSALANTSWTEVMTTNTISLNGQITLAPYQFYILKP
ncbi:MAG: alpha-glucosidase C-terminal domain-containing protein [Bacteroidales bacterium]|nr:alpha-glucosidase C-terminal domain-containing protein [Bacteroidales bacterium]